MRNNFILLGVCFASVIGLVSCTPDEVSSEEPCSCTPATVHQRIVSINEKIVDCDGSSFCISGYDIQVDYVYLTGDFVLVNRRVSQYSSSSREKEHKYLNQVKTKEINHVDWDFDGKVNYSGELTLVFDNVGFDDSGEEPWLFNFDIGEVVTPPIASVVFFEIPKEAIAARYVS